jgi:glycosyltransferase involved in cell wall biosynthesis
MMLIDPALSDGYPRRKQLQDVVLPRADRVVVYGRVQESYLAREYGGRVRSVFLHHRADTKFYTPMAAAPAATPLVFSIGNDVSRDFDTLVAAARLRTARAPGAQQFVVRTTRSVADATPLELRSETVSFPELRALYASAAVVVVPLHDSRHAGGINALLEAMAMGRPIVVSGSAGIADYVDDGESALVVPPGDAAALAAAIGELLENPVLAQRLGTQARATVVDRCANATYARHLADVLRAMVGSKLL